MKTISTNDNKNLDMNVVDDGKYVKVIIGTEELEDGVSPLDSGTLYIYYEV